MELPDMTPGLQTETTPAAPPGEGAPASDPRPGAPYPEGTIGHLMDAPVGVFRAGTRADEMIRQLRVILREALITYPYVVDESGRLVGLVVMRELLLAEPQQPVDEFMIREPFCLRPEMPLLEGMRSVIRLHYPVYPVCDAEGRLVGLVRGENLFAAQAVEISAQPGKMVGVEKEERLSTPLGRSLRFRHPWLQVNLLTAFLAAAVVGAFQSTIDQIVLHAVFLPVLAGQSGNTGAQALAVTLRGMTLGELERGSGRRLVYKEGLLGLGNGLLVGVTAGIGMFVYARMEQNPNALLLSAVVFMAMVVSCVLSGMSGALVPLVLRRLGADPATASSIFLSTSTDVVSMSLFLGLATWLLL
jgi:magnesium transporter